VFIIASDNDACSFAAIIVLLYAVSNVGGNYQHDRRETLWMGIPLREKGVSLDPFGVYLIIMGSRLQRNGRQNGKLFRWSVVKVTSWEIMEI